MLTAIAAQYEQKEADTEELRQQGFKLIHCVKQDVTTTETAVQKKIVGKIEKTLEGEDVATVKDAMDSVVASSSLGYGDVAANGYK